MTPPHCGSITGMGIPKGITLIVGGGYHGKSTLLKALELGIYNHIAGDGREYVITDDTAVKLRAEDGRSIRRTDISLFINDLPNGKDTTSFSTEDASGSTSQAANTIEAIESGTSLFLIDEDTSATNFMIRDELMQRVVSRHQEPMTHTGFHLYWWPEVQDPFFTRQTISFRWKTIVQKILLKPQKLRPKISLRFPFQRKRRIFQILSAVSLPINVSLETAA